ALRGHTVDVGPRGSETETLARMVLSFAQLVGPAAGEQRLVPSNLEYEELRVLHETNDLVRLPDALFQLAIVPSQLALPLIRDHGYRLVPLPFADAMRLDALLTGTTASAHEVDWQYVTDATVPAFTYSMRPP